MRLLRMSVFMYFTFSCSGLRWAEHRPVHPVLRIPHHGGQHSWMVDLGESDHVAETDAFLAATVSGSAATLSSTAHTLPFPSPCFHHDHQLC